MKWRASSGKPYKKYYNNSSSNGNDIETKAKENLNNGVFFDIEAKRTPLTEQKLFSPEANTFNGKKIIFKAKWTHLTVCKLFLKQSEHIRYKENYFRSEANTLERGKKYFRSEANTLDIKKIIL